MKPLSLKQSNTYRTNKHAIEQVQQYMDGLERIDRHKKERLAGVVLDGGFYIFIRHREERWRIDDPLPVDAHSTETFLRYLLSLSTELALTPDKFLARDFGENSDTARRVVPALYAAIKSTTNPKANILFTQWQRQFREVSGYDASSGQLDPDDVAKLYAVRDRSIDLERLFLLIHTYYATFIKLLALQVVHFYLMPKVGSGLTAAADYESAQLQKWLQKMERGGLFKELGIPNWEGDFFGWYLDIWDERLDAALRRLIGDLSNYAAGHAGCRSRRDARPVEEVVPEPDAQEVAACAGRILHARLASRPSAEPGPGLRWQPAQAAARSKRWVGHLCSPGNQACAPLCRR